MVAEEAWLCGGGLPDCQGSLGTSQSPKELGKEAWYSDLHPALSLILRQGLQMNTLVQESIHTHDTQQYVQKSRPGSRLGEKAWPPGVKRSAKPLGEGSQHSLGIGRPGQIPWVGVNSSGHFDHTPLTSLLFPLQIHQELGLWHQ